MKYGGVSITLNIGLYKFVDYYHHTVEISFKRNPYSDHPKHVWIICKYHDMWLMTRHADRGIEFPGGKVEEGETPEQAARREVYEETGGRIKTLSYIGQYKVTATDEIVVKNVYYAEIDELETKDHYFETKGPLLMKELPNDIKTNRNFSFIMKDDVLLYSFERIKALDNKNC